MIKLPKIHTVYQANYNGFDMWIDEDANQRSLTEHDDEEVAKAAEAVNEQVCDKLYIHCDEDGVFQGHDGLISLRIGAALRKHFGRKVNFDVEIDTFST